MSRKTIVVNMFVIDSDNIGRAPTGEPRINGETFDYQLIMATPSGNGFVLETWHPGRPARQDIDLVPNLDYLVARIAARIAAGGVGE